MGSGKTRFVRAVVEGLEGSPTDVSSPTFVLLQQYSARLPVHHADAYRLTSETEFLDLGPEEWLTGPGVVLIEWADRISNCLPDDRVDVSITSTGETLRANHLKIIGGEPVHRSQATLFKSRNAPWADGERDAYLALMRMLDLDG